MGSISDPAEDDAMNLYASASSVESSVEERRNVMELMIQMMKRANMRGRREV